MKKVRILHFTKNKVMSISDKFNDPFDVIQCGHSKFTLKDFKLQGWHVDSLPYSATLFYNGKPFAKCVNDGWGGKTDIMPLNAQTRAIFASVLQTLTNYKFIYRNTEFTLGVDLIADLLAQTAAKESN
jgi:hypothetical protein